MTDTQHTRRTYKHYDTAAILDWIVHFKRNSGGLSPTIQEICDQFDISSKSVCWHILRNLNAEGKIELSDHIARSISIPGEQYTCHPIERNGG